MTTATAPSELVVLDLASLQLHRHGQTVTVFTAAREVVTTLELADGTSRRAAVQACFEQALTARLPRPVPGPHGRPQLLALQVALYNPYTAQIAVGRITDASLRVYGDARPLHLPAAGATAGIVDGCLHLDGRTLPRVDDQVQPISSLLAAHRDPQLV